MQVCSECGHVDPSILILDENPLTVLCTDCVYLRMFTVADRLLVIKE